MKRIHIKFDNKGEGKMECQGYKEFRCLAKKGLKYCSGQVNLATI
jgi:hypothetical protein